MGEGNLSTLLQSLIPKDEEELSTLRRLLHHAQRIANGGPEEVYDAQMVAAIPQEARKYFHGLVEAVEIYQTIRGGSIPASGLKAQDPSIRELKQIRDLCLQGGFGSVY